jgi:Tol biopolymer transport system component
MWFRGGVSWVGGLVALLGAAAVASVIGSGVGAAAGMPGGRIAFSRGLSPGRYEIWTMTANGGGLRRLTGGCQWDWFPAWSLDGKRLAFTRICGSSSAVYVVNSNGTGLHRVTPAGLNAEWPSWSPDGQRVAFAGGSMDGAEIYVINTNGTMLRRLTHNRVADATPAWSPHGRNILFSSKRAPGGSHQLMLISPAGGAARALPLRGGEPAWSPDGTQIAWAQAVKGAARETDNIWVANADGSHPRQVTHEQTGITSHHPTWSPDGHTIAFMSNHAAASNGACLWQINTNSKGLRQLTHAPYEDADPAWQPAARLKRHPTVPTASEAQSKTSIQQSPRRTGPEVRTVSHSWAKQQRARAPRGEGPDDPALRREETTHRRRGERVLAVRASSSTQPDVNGGPGQAKEQTFFAEVGVNAVEHAQLTFACCRTSGRRTSP